MTYRATRWLRAASLVACLAAPVAGVQARVANGAADGPTGERISVASLDLSADRVVYTPAKTCDLGAGGCPATLRLTGRVSIVADAAQIRASRVELELDARGGAVSLSADGDVRIAVGGRTGVARRARLSPGKGRLVLEGGASLRWTSALRLDGERIELDLKRGQVTVQRARARLTRLDSGSR